MNIYDRKPHVVTDERINAYKKLKKGLYCGFCGEDFKEGDYIRFQYTNSTKGAGGNPFVCEKCDEGEGKNIEKFLALNKEYRKLRSDKRFRAVRKFNR